MVEEDAVVTFFDAVELLLPLHLAPPHSEMLTPVLISPWTKGQSGRLRTGPGHLEHISTVVPQHLLELLNLEVPDP